eukprot:475743_1
MLICVCLLIIHRLCQSQDAFKLWTTGTLMPNSQDFLFAGYDSTVNRIWLIGYQNRKWYYNITGNYFSNVGTLPVSGLDSWSQGSTQLATSMWFAQGVNIYEFDLTLGEMIGTSSPFANSNVQSPCFANNGEYIFLVAGQSSGNANTGTTIFQGYDTISGSWFVGDSLNARRHSLACNVSPDGKYLYAFGGFSGGSIQNTIERIDITNMNDVESGSVTWITTPLRMKANYFYHRSVVDSVNNLIYLFCGRVAVASAREARIQIIDLSTQTNHLSSVSLNTARSFGATIMVKQRIYVFGGYETNNKLRTWEYSNIMTYDPTPSPTPNPTPSPTDNPTPSTPTADTVTPTQSPTVCVDFTNEFVSYNSNDGFDNKQTVNILPQLNESFAINVTESVIFYNEPPTVGKPIPYIHALITCDNSTQLQICYIHCIGAASCLFATIAP